MQPWARISTTLRAMSAKRRSALAGAAQLRRLAHVRLCDRAPCSISQLTNGSPTTRQAITKHLLVLETVGLVRGEMSGRERLFELEPKALLEAQEFLTLVSSHWDSALERLKAHVEDAP